MENLFSSGLITVLIFVIFTFIVLFNFAFTVPQGMSFIIERLGKFNRIASPGLNFKVPFLESVSYKVTTKDIVLDIPSQDVITKDNAVIVANAVAYINILSPEKAVYGVEDYEIAIQTLVQTSLRSIIGELALDEALSSREQIKTTLKGAIADDIADWGITLKTVEIQDINPSGTMQSAMEEQAAAERARRAAVTRAEGEKAATVLEAEGRLEASLRDAKAQVVLAEANRSAIEKVSSAINEQELPAMYLLGERYVKALSQLSSSDNAKMIVLPADLTNAIRGLFGQNK